MTSNMFLHLLLLSSTHRVIGEVHRIDTRQVDSVLVDHLLPDKLAIENSITDNEDMMQKVRDLLAAAQVYDTINDIIKDLHDQEVPVTEKPKSPEDLFRELIDNMEKPLAASDQTESLDREVFSLNSNDPEDYTGNIDYTENDGSGDLFSQYYSDYDAILSDINVDDLLQGDSDETKGNIDLTYNEDPIKLQAAKTTTTTNCYS